MFLKDNEPVEFDHANRTGNCPESLLKDRVRLYFLLEWRKAWI